MIEIIKPTIFPKNIIAGVTKRNVSSEFPLGMSFSTSNLSTNEEVVEMRNILAKQINLDFANMRFQHQTHSDIVRIVGNSSIEQSDAMITDEVNTAICVSIADCAAILLYDSETDVIAGVHSGWRGSAKRIVQKSIQQMSKNYGTNPKKVLAHISPCASGDNYEVGWEVAELFPNSIKSENEKYYFDNKKEIKSQLIESGLDNDNIEISEICTIENEDFHSFRRDGEKSGRMIAFIGNLL